MASSRALVCKDCVPPKAAAAASIHVRATLLKGSCSVRLQPLVWQCVLRAKDFGFFGLNCFTSFAHNILAALILAISIKWFIPMAQKNDRRGAKVSISIPAFKPLRMYSSPSASVYANSISQVAPASCIWYPEIEMLLNLGMFFDVYWKISLIIFMDGVGG